MSGDEADRIQGLVVVSTGRYAPLTSNAPPIGIDESIPEVTLSDAPMDKRCFGVVSGLESSGGERTYALGTFVSVMPKQEGERRLIVNSVGEGAIWVCDANGPLENGDYVTTSALAGYAMRQDSPFMANYTVAKVTCDCDFDDLPPYIQRRTVQSGGREFRCAFVGCTYHCG